MTDFKTLRFRRIGSRSFGIAATLGFVFAASCSAEDPERVGSNQSALSANVVIAEVYAGGGNAGAPYTNDFVLLFNRGSAAAPIGAMSLQYAAAGSNFAAAGALAMPAGASIPAGGYYLVQLAAGATPSGALPTPDHTGTLALGATAGKVALVTVPLDACGQTATQCPTTNIVDFVGYGATAQQFEGSGPTPAPSNTTSAHRKGGGCVETDNNASDFETGAPTPKNSATAPALCGATDSGSGGTGGTDASTGGTGGTVDAGPDTGPVDAGPPPVGLVIAELYGGSGNNAPFTNDYVVIFNRGSASASTANLHVQYASATGSFGTSAFNVTDLSTVTLAPGQYFLVGLGAAGFDAGTPAPLPTPDATGTTNLSSTTGKVALTHGALLTGCGAAGTPCSGPGLLDLVGYGATAPSQVEGSGPAPTPGSFSNGVIRKLGGCTDTDENANDFLAAAAGPKNTASPLNNCGLLPDTGTGGAGGTDSGTGGTAGTASGGTAGTAAGGAAGSAAGGSAGTAAGGTGGGFGGSGGGSGGGSTGGSGGVKPDGGGGVGNIGGFAGKKGGGSGDDGGCGCETPGNAQNSSGLALLSLLGLAAFARRRRS